MGENAVVERGTSGDGGSRVPNEITVESLIERYNNADFNRRWDSYETAGWILSDVKAAEFRIDAVEQFDKYHSDKFSVAQAEEIRGLIRTALENRDRAQDFIDVMSEYLPSNLYNQMSFAYALLHTALLLILYLFLLLLILVSFTLFSKKGDKIISQLINKRQQNWFGSYTDEEIKLLSQLGET
ncbi:MAG: hypothetical protein K2J80_10035 [Oscillospiraceae bacterium]|nr:hypothetical protein [Oscillospiraceae bacterium]